MFMLFHVSEMFFDVFQTKFLMKNTAFWDITPRASCENDVSEERIASIIMVTRISELGTTLPVTRKRSMLRRSTAHGVQSQKTTFFIVTAVKTSNRT
jgi:hypothetical protein